MGKYDEHFYVEEEIEKQLLDGEKIIWRSKPFKPAFIVNKNLKNGLVFIFSVSNFLFAMLPLILSEEMPNVIFFRTVLLLCGIIVFFFCCMYDPFFCGIKRMEIYRVCTDGPQIDYFRKRKRVCLYHCSVRRGKDVNFAPGWSG